MQELSNVLTSLNRPKLLVRTARLAMEQFKRETTLLRIFGYEYADDPTDVLKNLVEYEEEIDFQRKTGDATYSIARHVSVLAALMSEAKTYLQPSKTLT